MIEEVNSRLMPLPGSIGGFVVKKDMCYTIVVNECMSDEARLRFYLDEMDHIRNGDLDSEEAVDEIEIRAHGL